MDLLASSGKSNRYAAMTTQAEILNRQLNPNLACPASEIGCHLSKVTPSKAPSPPPKTRGPDIVDLHKSSVGFTPLVTCHAPAELNQRS